MRNVKAVATLIASLLCAGSLSHAATVTGTVKGPDGAPFKGAFVEAQNSATKITVNVLSTPAWSLPHRKSPPRANTTCVSVPFGYRADQQSGSKTQPPTQKVSANFALQTGIDPLERPLRVSRQSRLLPEGKGKQLMASANASPATCSKAAWRPRKTRPGWLGRKP